MKRTPNAAKRQCSWRSSFPSVIALCGLIFIVFFSVGFFGFILWDDDQNFILNPWVRGGLETRYWVWAWTTRLLSVYQPISWILFQVQHLLVPQNPARFIHLVSLFLHMANATIVFVLCRTLGNSSEADQRPAALCGALYFGLHPLQCEAVAWASCQPYLLASFWGGLSLLCFLKSVETSKSRFCYGTSVALFAASLLSKSIFVSLPVLLGILRFSRERSHKFTFRIAFGIIQRDWLFWFCSFCAFMLALWARIGGPSHQARPLFESVKRVPAFFGFFVEKSFFPVSLSPLYDLSLAKPTEIILGVLLIIGTFACLRRGDRRKGGLVISVLIVFLLPGLAAAMTEGILFGDRYAYLPNAVVGLIVSMAIYRFQKAKNYSVLLPRFCAVLLSVGLAIPSRHQIAVWSDSVRLWQHAVEHGAALSHKAHDNLGLALAGRGQTEEAIVHYRKALEIQPDFVDAHNNLGLAMAVRGQADEAITHFKKVLEIQPDCVDAHNNLGAVLAGRGQIDEAIAHYRRALEINPDFAESHVNLGTVLSDRAEIAEAITHFQKALEIQPELAEVRRNLEALLRRRQ